MLFPAIMAMLGLGIFACGLMVLQRALRDLWDPWSRNGPARRFHPWTGAAVGVVSTALLQSSSAVNAAVALLVGSGALPFRHGAMIVAGSNVGTTATGQLAALSSSRLGLIVFGLGFFLAALGRGRLQQGGRAAAGLGGLFFGLSVMTSSLSRIRSAALFLDSLAYSQGSAFLAGLAATATVQSSSVAIGMLMAMADANLISLSAAVAAMLGANVGTVTTTVAVSLTQGVGARRIALFDLLLNAVGALLAWPLVHLLISAAQSLSKSPGQQLAHAHTLFNAGTLMLAMLALKPACAWIERALPLRN